MNNVRLAALASIIFSSHHRLLSILNTLTRHCKTTRNIVLFGVNILGMNDYDFNLGRAFQFLIND